MTDAAAVSDSARKTGSYLRHSRDGRGSGGFYLLGLLVILLVWIVVAPLVSAALAILLGGSAEQALVSPDAGFTEPWRSLAVSFAPFVVVLAGVLATVRWVLGRPPRTVVTGRERVSVGRMAVGAAVFFALIALATAVEALIEPDAYSLTFDPARFVPALIVVLLLVPIQAASEEVLFRGYVIQWTSLGTDRSGRAMRPWPRLLVLSAVSGFVFALPHLANPEAQGAPWYGWLAWFVLGAGWAAASVLDGRIELAIGAHIANNIFSVVVVANTTSVVATAGIWTSSRINWGYVLVSTVVIMLLFIGITCRGRRPPAGTS